MKNLKLEIFLNERFYGALCIKKLYRGVITEEEIQREIETRLPLLKGKKYTVSF